MYTREPMLDMFIFETCEMLEHLQQIIIDSEKIDKLESATINEIFRIMHTIKGSSGMMMFNNISSISHTIEDLFYFIRESKPEKIDYSIITDLVLEGSDLIKLEIEKINNDKEADGDFTVYIEKVNEFLSVLKNTNGISDDTYTKKSNTVEKKIQKYYLSKAKTDSNINLFKAVLLFEKDCEMENIRCFAVIHKLKDIAEILYFEPEDIIENNDICEIIKEEGFKILFKSTESIDYIERFFMETAFLNKVDVEQFDDEGEFNKFIKIKDTKNSVSNNINELEKEVSKTTNKQKLISVDVDKLDKLMDLVGELVISEAMVTKNSQILDLKIESFEKAARQHRKRLSDLQDVVMSIRMVSLGPTLNKMNRIVRDMCKKLDKEVDFKIIGQETEVDKNIIEHISDPLMHIVRNSIDHGIESKKERIACGKSQKGELTIEAKNNGGEVWIIIKDDGKGLDKDKILKKAKDNGLLKVKETEISDKEIYSLIFMPGFSTNDNVTEFSGRGVGMDVVVKNIEKIRGAITVDSEPNNGTTIIIKIPLTLAIVDGMTIKVGKSVFTIPVTSIRESIIIKKEDIIKDLDNKEMVLIRGECYSILRLHEFYNIKTDVLNIEDGIVIMIEDEGKAKCIFVDKLIGEQQVVIKGLPEYIKKVKAVIGCALLGDGSISFIIDTSDIVNI